MRRFGFILPAVFFCLFYVKSNSYADLVSDGRAKLFNKGNPTYSGILDANQKFRDALITQPNDQKAILFYSVTRLAVSMLKSGTGGGLETLRDVFESFGMTHNTNHFLHEGFPYDMPSELPYNSPGGEKIRQFLAGPFMTLLNEIQADLAKISNSFNIIIPASETGDRAVEIDYGDILIFEAILNAKRLLVLILSSYDLNVDIDEIIRKIRNDQFSINDDLLKPYPELQKLSGGGEVTMKAARTALLETINSYLAASEFIRTETDNQLDDLITIYTEDAESEALFRQNLIELKTSLNQNRNAYLTDNDKYLLLNLNPFFGNGKGPYNLRDFLPEFNNSNKPINGTMGHGLGNDPTLGGIFPEFSQSDWGLEATSRIYERIMNWAESILPELLPTSGKMIYDQHGLYFRYYPGTGIYLGAYEGKFLYYHPAISPDIYDLGFLDEWISVAGNAGF